MAITHTRSLGAPREELRPLYPPVEPYGYGHLAVDDHHQVYYEQCGNPDGKPAVFVHGGPGGGAGEDYRRFFDPEAYRIVLFDQRGCKRSKPYASLKNNTTWHLVGDIERIREHLGIDRWLVFGGSWGSTLSLSYAQKHPERVTELVLRGIFMLRRKELLWFYQEGASHMYPDAWEKYLKPIPEVERGDLMSAYYRRLTSDDETTRVEAARAWSTWEGGTSLLYPDEKKIAETGADGVGSLPALAGERSRDRGRRGTLRVRTRQPERTRQGHRPVPQLSPRHDRGPDRVMGYPYAVFRGPLWAGDGRALRGGPYSGRTITSQKLVSSTRSRSRRSSMCKRNWRRTRDS